MATDSAEPIVKKLLSVREEFLAALTNNYFYVELLFVSIAIAISWLFAYAVRYRTNIYLTERPLQKIDNDFLTKPLSLLAPILSYMLLNMAQPLAEEYSKNSLLTYAAIQFCLYYIMAKSILLIIISRPVAWFIAIAIMIVGVLDVSGFTTITNAYLSSKNIVFGTYKISMLNLVHGLTILVVVLWGAGLLSRALESYLRRSSSLSYNSRELMVKFFKIFIYFVALLIGLSVMGVDLTAFAVFGGALGVGIGLGLQKITANFISGITLLIEKSIKLGDLIEVGNVTGWVRQLNIRYALIESFDGKEILIPNEELLTTRVTNWTYSHNRARIEIVVGISYNSDAKRARELILSAAKSHPDCMRDPEPSCFLTDFAESSINFLLTFWVGDVKNGKLGPKSDVMYSILDKFKAENIEIPYPQRVVYLNKEKIL